MKKQLALAIFLCASLFPLTALAETNCPEGTTSFINTQTKEQVCLPTNTNTIAPANASPASADASVQINQAAQSDTTADSVQTSSDTTQQVSQGTQAAVPPAPESTDSAPQSTNNIQKSKEITGTMPVVIQTSQDSRKQMIHESLMEPGFSALLGLGYGLLLNVNLHIMFGYQFGSTHDIARFGLYLNTSLKPGYEPFSMDFTVTPTLHLSTGRFRFSFGMGIGFNYQKYRQNLIRLFGIGGWLDDSDESERKEKEERRESEFRKLGLFFEFTPTLIFDFFLTENAFWGFGFEVPIVVDEEAVKTIFPLFNLDLHIGYKF